MQLIMLVASFFPAALWMKLTNKSEALNGINCSGDHKSF